MSLENVLTENIINGMKKAFNNAEFLLQEAQLLKSNKMFPRAYLLCQLAIEELAKIPMLFNLLIDRINENAIDYNQINKSFKDHPTKTKISIEFEIAIFKMYKNHLGKSWADKLIKEDEELITRIHYLNKLKNESLYVSIINKDFQSPDEVIDEAMVQSLFSSAFIRKSFFKNIIDVTKKSICEIARLVKESN